MRLKTRAPLSGIPQPVLRMFTCEIRSTDLSEADREFISNMRYFGSFGDELNLWNQYADLLTERAAEKTPGSRPRGWWRFAAPAASAELLRSWGLDPAVPYFTAPYYRECPREPRLRLGGVGTPTHEVLADLPVFSFGIPLQWIDQPEVDFYCGRLCDVRGNIVMPEYVGREFAGVPINPNDPPVFESSAVYLKRHGLFLPGEERRLTPADFEPETVTL